MGMSGVQVLGTGYLGGVAKGGHNPIKASSQQPLVRDPASMVGIYASDE